MTTARNDHQRSLARISIPPDVLTRPRVAVQLATGQESRPAALAAFMMASNILVRLFHDVTLLAPDAPMPRNPWKLKTVSELVAMLRGVAAGSVGWNQGGPFDVVLGIGRPPNVIARRTTFISFAGWRAGLEKELGPGPEGPLGALFASCYGASQTLLLAAQDFGADRRPIAPFCLSLLDHADTSADAPMPAVSLDGLHLVGAGAVGSACVYGMGHLDGLTGHGHVIDNDQVDDSNLLRYVLMRRSDVGLAKVDVAAAVFDKSDAKLEPHPMSFRGFRDCYGTKIDLMLTPVDSEAGRCALAKELPRQVINAATGDSNVTVSCHGFADGRACLHCLYRPKPEEMTMARRLALDMGLGESEVESLLLDNRPIGIDIVRQVERQLGKPSGTFDEWASKHIQSFYQRAVCSEAMLPVAGGTLISPLPFISAAAGVFLAAELVKTRNPALARWCLDNYFRFDLFAAPNPAFRQTRRPSHDGKCICQNLDFQDVYRGKYGSTRF